MGLGTRLVLTPSPSTSDPLSVDDGEMITLKQYSLTVEYKEVEKC